MLMGNGECDWDTEALEMNSEFRSGGGHFEHLRHQMRNTITLSLFICELRASKLCIHIWDTLYINKLWKLDMSPCVLIPRHFHLRSQL
jgi:hypothetical protein